MQYEYKILKTDTPTASEEQFNQNFGADGWLLVTIIRWDDGNGDKWYYYFTRPKNCH